MGSVNEEKMTVSTQRFGDWHRVVPDKMGEVDDLSPSGERGSADAGQ